MSHSTFYVHPEKEHSSQKLWDLFSLSFQSFLTSNLLHFPLLFLADFLLRNSLRVLVRWCLSLLCGQNLCICVTVLNLNAFRLNPIRETSFVPAKNIFALLSRTEEYAVPYWIPSMSISYSIFLSKIPSEMAASNTQNFDHNSCKNSLWKQNEAKQYSKEFVLWDITKSTILREYGLRYFGNSIFGRH